MGPRSQESPMSDGVRHPRLVAAFRAVLYATAGTVALGVALLAVLTVGFVVSAGSLALALTGNAHLVAVFVLSALVLATSAGLLWGLKVAVQRIDREVREFDRAPDPVEEVKERYVDGDVDEAELDRRLDHELRSDADPPPPGEAVAVRSESDRAAGDGDRGDRAPGDAGGRDEADAGEDADASDGGDSDDDANDSTGDDANDSTGDDGTVDDDEASDDTTHADDHEEDRILDRAQADG